MGGVDGDNTIQLGDHGIKNASSCHCPDAASAPPLPPGQPFPLSRMPPRSFS